MYEETHEKAETNGQGDSNDSHHHKPKAPQSGVGRRVETTRKDLHEVERALSRPNVGNVERVLSVVVGAAILLAVRRKALFYAGLTALAAYLMYRGIGGRCRLYEEIGVDTSDYDFEALGFDEVDVPNVRRGHSDGSSAEATADSGMAELDPRAQVDSDVDEAAIESFPASDPPSTW